MRIAQYTAEASLRAERSTNAVGCVMYCVRLCNPFSPHRSLLCRAQLCSPSNVQRLRLWTLQQFVVYPSLVYFSDGKNLKSQHPASASCKCLTVGRSSCKTHLENSFLELWRTCLVLFGAPFVAAVVGRDLWVYCSSLALSKTPHLPPRHSHVPPCFSKTTHGSLPS